MDHEWLARAACANSDPEEWFPRTFAEGGVRVYLLARQYCNACPVRPECARDALACGDTQGIRAGVFLGTDSAAPITASAVAALEAAARRRVAS